MSGQGWPPGFEGGGWQDHHPGLGGEAQRQEQLNKLKKEVVEALKEPEKQDKPEPPVDQEFAWANDVINRTTYPYHDEGFTAEDLARAYAIVDSRLFARPSALRRFLSWPITTTKRFI